MRLERQFASLIFKTDSTRHVETEVLFTSGIRVKMDLLNERVTWSDSSLRFSGTASSLLVYFAEHGMDQELPVDIWILSGEIGLFGDQQIFNHLDFRFTQPTPG